jgi:hypothetical protein
MPMMNNAYEVQWPIQLTGVWLAIGLVTAAIVIAMILH